LNCLGSKTRGPKSASMCDAPYRVHPVLHCRKDPLIRPGGRRNERQRDTRLGGNQQTPGALPAKGKKNKNKKNENKTACASRPRQPRQKHDGRITTGNPPPAPPRGSRARPWTCSHATPARPLSPSGSATGTPSARRTKTAGADPRPRAARRGVGTTGTPRRCWHGRRRRRGVLGSRGRGGRACWAGMPARRGRGPRMGAPCSWAWRGRRRRPGSGRGDPSWRRRRRG
jgi:hypothetical protein